MEFLSLDLIREKEPEIREAFNRLIANKALANKPSSKQWRFFKACLEGLFNPTGISSFDEVAPVTAAQYKFEVEDKLTRFYQRPGTSQSFVFSLCHKKHLVGFGLGLDKPYPSIAGYGLLVRDLAGEALTPVENDKTALKAYLERVISEAADAEFRAYQALPEVRTEDLKRWFYPGSPAYKEIANLLERHRFKGWTLTNPLNPSTKRILDIKVKTVGAAESVVHTTEYWYLRWWNTRKESYAYPYRETNRQVYILKKDGADWKVFENLRPSPRTSAPHRKARKT